MRAYLSQAFACLVLFEFCVEALKNESTMGGHKKRFYKMRKLEQNFSTSIKIIDLSRVVSTTYSSFTPISPIKEGQHGRKQPKLVKKRKRIKLKRKKFNGNFLFEQRFHCSKFVELMVQLKKDFIRFYVLINRKYYFFRVNLFLSKEKFCSGNYSFVYTF